MALSKITITPNVGGTRCLVCEVLRDLPKADAKQLENWMRDRSVPMTAIAEACRLDPDTPSLGTASIGRHIRGQCLNGERLRS